MYRKWMIVFIASIFLTAIGIVWLLLRQFDGNLGAASFIAGWFTLFGIAGLVPIIWLFLQEDKRLKQLKDTPDGEKDEE